MGGGRHREARICLQLTAPREGESGFLAGVVPGRLTMLQCMAPHPHTWAVLLAIIKKRKRREEEKEEKEEEEEEEDEDEMKLDRNMMEVRGLEIGEHGKFKYYVCIYVCSMSGISRNNDMS